MIAMIITNYSIALFETRQHFHNHLLKDKAGSKWVATICNRSLKTSSLPLYSQNIYPNDSSMGSLPCDLRRYTHFPARPADHTA